MPNPGSIIGAITEELGETARQVVKQTAQVPKEVGQAALESLGASQGTSQTAKTTAAVPAKGSGEKTVLDDFQNATDERTKREIARNALAYLAGQKNGQEEPSTWERKTKEEEQKKEMQKEQKKQERMQNLPAITTKPKRGNLFGITKKKSGAETSRNVRQD